MKPKLIVDIRHYENPARTEVGNASPSLVGSLYPVPDRSLSRVGTRLACKLREMKFNLPGFDHVYVILTPALPDGIAAPSLLKFEPRVRYVDVGLSPTRWESLDNDSKHDELVDTASAALLEFSDSREVVEAVSRELKQWRSLLEITIKSKETAKYRVDISFQIRPLQNSSIAYLTYYDKETGQRGRAVLTELELADHIYLLCGSISVKNGIITVHPRTSFRAGILTKKYDTPMTVSVDTILTTSVT